MFHNHKISSTQFGRLLVLSTLGSSLCIMPSLLVRTSGRDGIFSLLLSYVLTIFYTKLIFFICKHQNGKQQNTFWSWILLLKYTVVLIPILCLLTQITRILLIPQRSIWSIMLLFLILCFYFMKQGAEAIARLAQVVYYPVLVLCILPIVIQLPEINLYEITPLYHSSFTSILSSSLLLVFLLFPMELLLFMQPLFHSEEFEHQLPKKCTAGISMVYGVNFLSYLADLGILGSTELLQNALIPASMKLLVRLRASGILLLFILCSIVFSITLLLLAISHFTRDLVSTDQSEVPRKKFMERAFLLFLGILMFAASMGTFHIVPLYSNARFVNQEQENIEQRIYVNSILLDYLPEHKAWQMCFIFQKNNENDAVIAEFSGENIAELLPEYYRSHDKQLDFSHTEVLLLGETIYQNREHFQDALQYLNELDQLNRQTLLCGMKQSAEAFLALEENLEIALGKYLKDMVHANLPYAKTTLEDVKHLLDYRTASCNLAAISIQNQCPYYAGTILITSEGQLAEFMGEQALLLNLICGKKGFAIPLIEPDGMLFQVDENKVRLTCRQTSKDEIQLSIEYSGTLSPVNQGVAGGRTKSIQEYNQYLETWMENQLLVIYQDFHCDLLNGYRQLALNQPKLFLEYETQSFAFAKICIPKVRCYYRITSASKSS